MKSRASDLAASGSRAQYPTMRAALFPLCLLLTACGAVAPAPGPTRIYALFSLDDEPFAPNATISFGDQGRVSGHGPCNRWSAQLTAPLPAFAIDGITATEMACDALPAEAIFFNTLNLMTSAEFSGDTVILRDDTHRSMVFRATE